MRKKNLIVVVLLCLFSFVIYAESIDIEIRSFTTASSADTSPFWISSNDYGVIGGDPYQIGSTLSIYQDIPLTEKIKIDYSVVGALNSTEEYTGRFIEGFLRFKWKKFYTYAGRMKQTIGSTYVPLSVGSMAISPNATPIPRVAAGLSDFTTVPYTHGLLEVKGMLGHGWLGESRYVEAPLLHEKNAFIRVGLPEYLQFHTGLIHEAVWAGTSPVYGDLPSSFSDYVKIFFNQAGGDDSPAGEADYRLGDSKGVWDFGVNTLLFDYKLFVYYQHFFEDNTGFRLKNGEDGLLGVLIKPPSYFVSSVLYEFLYTKHQSGDNPWYELGGRDNYYNHSIYRSGWTYLNDVLGNPLFGTTGSDENIRFNNNRIVAHHIGVEGHMSPSLTYKLLATYSKNYGTYPDRTYEEAGGLDQYSFLVQIRKEGLFNQSSLAGTVGIGVDVGELREDNIGVLLEGTWSGSFDIFNK